MSNIIATPSIDLATEGKALNDEFKRRQRRDSREFRKDMQEGGFIRRLADVIGALKADALAKGGKNISQDALKAVGITDITRQFVSDVLWFHENQNDVLAFLDSNKKRQISNLEYIRREFRKAEKKAQTSDKSSGSAESGNADASEADASETQDAPMTAAMLADATIAAMIGNGIDTTEFLSALRDRLATSMKRAA